MSKHHRIPRKKPPCRHAGKSGTPRTLSARIQRVMAERSALLAQSRAALAANAALFPDIRKPGAGTGVTKPAADSAFGRLQEACERSTSLFDFAPIGYLVLNEQGQILESNQTFARMLGRSTVSLSRMFMSGLISKGDISKLLTHLGCCKTSDATAHTELSLIQKAGPPLPVELISSIFDLRKGGPPHYRTIVIDLTQRRQAESLQHQLQANYHALIDSIQGVVWEGHARGDEWRFTFLSQQVTSLVGYPTHRWLLEPDFWEHRLHPEDRPQVMAERAKALKEERDHVLEYRLIDAKRNPVWVRDSVTLRKDASRTHLHGILINISELKDAHESLRRANNDLELRVENRTAALANVCVELHNEIMERKRLAKELLDLTESSRRREGVDFHGDFGQSLTGIGFLLKSLGIKLERTAPDEAPHAEKIKGLLDQTLARTRDPAQDLAAFGLQERTLPLALQGLANRAESVFDVSCRFKPNGKTPPIEEDVFTQVYHIAQEAVVDAVKFGGAVRIGIALSTQSERLTLTVEHDGHPFATPLHHSLDLGLKIMSFRAKLIGAALRFDETPAHTLTVTCVFAPKGPAAPEFTHAKRHPSPSRH